VSLSGSPRAAPGIGPGVPQGPMIAPARLRVNRPGGGSGAGRSGSQGAAGIEGQFFLDFPPDETIIASDSPSGGMVRNP